MTPSGDCTHLDTSAADNDTAPESGRRLSAAESRRRFREELSAVIPTLRPRALKLCLNPVEAQDLLQETVLRALRFEDSYKSGTNLRAWMNQILFSVFVTRCRKLRRERRALDALSTDPCAWMQRDAEPMMQSLTPSVQVALDELPPQFASVIMLVDLEERSYKDAAAKLGVPVGTVMSRLFRGRRLLAARLETEPQLAAA